MNRTWGRADPRVLAIVALAGAMLAGAAFAGVELRIQDLISGAYSGPLGSGDTLWLAPIVCGAALMVLAWVGAAGVGARDRVTVRRWAELLALVVAASTVETLVEDHLRVHEREDGSGAPLLIGVALVLGSLVAVAVCTPFARGAGRRPRAARAIQLLVGFAYVSGLAYVVFEVALTVVDSHHVAGLWNAHAAEHAVKAVALAAVAACAFSCHERGRPWWTLVAWTAIALLAATAGLLIGLVVFSYLLNFDVIQSSGRALMTIAILAALSVAVAVAAQRRTGPLLPLPRIAEPFESARSDESGESDESGHDFADTGEAVEFGA